MTRCPCGRGDLLDACCGPLLAGAPAPTAEALMRSRYTAFVRGDVDYLRSSWHSSTRPADLEPDPGVRWTFLEIVQCSGGGLLDTEGTVEFRAHYRGGTLHERSRFVREHGRWTYLDGVVG